MRYATIIALTLAVLGWHYRPDSAVAQQPPIYTCGIPDFPECEPTPTPGPTPVQTPSSVAGCELRNIRDDRTSGRFIWKPRAEHFNRALVVAPRHFYPQLPRVVMTERHGKRIERAVLKSNGRCADHPECLFASTWLFKRRGIDYQRRHGGVFIKIFNPRKPELGCYYYNIPSPGRRHAYR